MVRLVSLFYLVFCGFYVTWLLNVIYVYDSGLLLAYMVFLFSEV